MGEGHIGGGGGEIVSAVVAFGLRVCCDLEEIFGREFEIPSESLEGQSRIRNFIEGYLPKSAPGQHLFHGAYLLPQTTRHTASCPVLSFRGAAFLVIG